MLSEADNVLLTRTGPRTPMGELFRRFWHPVLLSEELPEPDGAHGMASEFTTRRRIEEQARQKDGIP